MSHIPTTSVRDHMKWAGLLGCEAVLSSMALMQASTISAPKKMMTSLAPPPVPGSTQRDPQGHMGLTAAMTCPPLVRLLHITHYTEQGRETVPLTTEFCL
ncbi:zinc finger protein 148 isoform X30 [Silurus meridionalis]|nr:zinc finger protein 148 isoform X30 [Silurus meridionalis]